MSATITALLLVLTVIVILAFTWIGKHWTAETPAATLTVLAYILLPVLIILQVYAFFHVWPQYHAGHGVLITFIVLTWLFLLLFWFPFVIWFGKFLPAKYDNHRISRIQDPQWHARKHQREVDDLHDRRIAVRQEAARLYDNPKDQKRHIDEFEADLSRPHLSRREARHQQHQQHRWHDYREDQARRSRDQKEALDPNLRDARLQKEWWDSLSPAEQNRLHRQEMERRRRYEAASWHSPDESAAEYRRQEEWYQLTGLPERR